MRKAVWVNGNKQLIESPHKGWNRECLALTTGNVWDSGYLSNYIRPRSEVECNGRINEVGHLQNFDINSFGTNIPSEVREYLYDIEKSKILMMVMTHREGRRVIHGWIIYTHDYNYTTKEDTVKVDKVFYEYGMTYKSRQLIDWIKETLEAKE